MAMPVLRVDRSDAKESGGLSVFHSMNLLPADIRQGCRALWAQPAWTIAALFCLAIGTGANTAAFSVINGVLLRPLLFDEPHQIVMIAVRSRDDRQAGPVSLEQFRGMTAAPDLFQQLAIRTFLPVGLAAEDAARMAQAEFVSGDYFPLLRLRPIAGRLLAPESDAPGREAEAVLSEKLWRIRFNRDPFIVGKTLRVNGRPVAVRGVAPAGFVGAMRIIAADIWLPASAYASFASPETPREAETRREYGLIGRLKPGVSVARAREQLGIVLGNTVLMEEATGFGVPPGVRPMVIGGSALLFGLMALLVAVAIANVAGLMLARATGRQKEIAVRLALGASPLRIVRQVLTESLILALGGAVLGALFAAALPSLLNALGPSLPEHLSFAVDLRPDWRTAVYAAICAIGIAMLFGLAPARQAARTNSSLAMRESAGNSRTRATSRTLNIFVTGQVAVSTVLLVTALLLGRTYLNTQGVDPGIDIRNTLAVSLDWSQTGLERAKARAFFEQLLSRVSSMPGVEHAALTRQPPLSPGGRNVTVLSDSSTAFTAGTAVVSDGYFETVRLPLLHGRNFGPADTGAQPAAIINETMARQLSPAGSPLGQTFSLEGSPGRRFEVIGVARDAKYQSLSEAPRALFYEPIVQTYSAQMTLLARTSIDPRLLIGPIRREIQYRNADLAAITIRTLEDQFQESAAPSRQRAVLLAGICGIGLMLSAFGLFGVMSYGVRQRVRELGVRMAVGARPADIAAMVLRQALQLVGIGFAAGSIAAFGVTRLIQSVLFGVSAHDPATLGIVGFLLAAVAIGAAYLPARWAMRVDPMLSIRAE
jgi:macrolide transport system ATP-binding/permease protein